MSARQQMFSDSWHRVAPERVRINPAVEIRKQVFRGQTWYLLRDPLNNEFFRISPAAYAFAGRLRGDKTVDEVWQECLALMPEDAPGQDEVIQVLSQLHRSNLIQSTIAADSRQLFERYKKNKVRKVRGQALNFLFLNIPLFDPDRLLTLLRPIFRPFLSPVGFVIWLGIVLTAGWVAIGHLGALADESSGVLAPKNLIWLYVCTVFIKIIHEFGHGIVCKHFGGEVRTAGVMLMMLTPLPYVDATSSWGFRSRWRRIAVSSGGMAAEFLVASIALCVWLHTSDPLLYRLAYNVMFIASVSTVLFNSNPLLRFDGYYIFSDLFDLPNLYQRATRQLKHLAERWLLGVKKSFSPADDFGEATWLTSYGIAAFCYRIFLLAFITYHVAQGFLGLGLAIAAFCVVMYFLVPIGKLLKYLFTSDRLERKRTRAILVTLVPVALLFAGVALVPLPHSFRASGVLQPKAESTVYAQSSGAVAEIYVESTQPIAAGDKIALLSNPELELDIESLDSKLDQIRTQIEEARQNQFGTIIGSLIEQLEAGQMVRKELQKQKDHLLVTAPVGGIWSSARAREMSGTWMPRGTELGRIIDFSEVIFVSAVTQQQSGHLFDDSIQSSEVRLYQRAETAIPVRTQTIAPGGQEKLPTAALGWLAGGEIQTKKGDESGMSAAEEFYLVRSELVTADLPLTTLGSLTGQIRFSLPPEPLEARWGRAARQLFSKVMPR